MKTLELTEKEVELITTALYFTHDEGIRAMHKIKHLVTDRQYRNAIHKTSAYAVLANDIIDKK